MYFAKLGAFFVSILASTVWSSPTPIDLNGVCTVVSGPTYIGEFNNVQVETLSCPEYVTSGFSQKRQGTNVCGANCATYCFTPAENNRPDPGQCNVIADALRYASQNTQSGPLFQIPRNTSIVMTYQTCRSFFFNQDLGDLVYCRTDWASLIDWIAPTCGPSKNAHGGLCVANDQRWFVQVQSTPQ